MNQPCRRVPSDEVKFTDSAPATYGGATAAAPAGWCEGRSMQPVAQKKVITAAAVRPTTPLRRSRCRPGRGGWLVAAKTAGRSPIGGLY